MTFSPDGKTLISGSNGGVIKIWRQKLSSDELVLSGEWWEILGVTQTTHAEEVKRAYLKLARQYHPDVNSSESAKAVMQAINQAYHKYRSQRYI